MDEMNAAAGAEDRRLSRLRLLMIGVAGALGAALGPRTSAARATDGSPLVVGTDNTSAAVTTLTNSGVDTRALYVDTAGTGVDAIVGNAEGAATAANPDPTGVWGRSVNGDGVLGETTHAASAGVFGYGGTAASFGVVGWNGTGSSGSVGVKGISAGGYGVHGTSTSGSGVVGQSTSGPGLQGFSDSQTGLTGSSNTTYGAFGSSQSGPGLGGFSNSGFGGYFQTQNAQQYAAYVNNAANGAGLFVNGSFVVAGGTKSAAVEIDDRLHLMYALEAPESLFEDVGSGRLSNGRARVDFDPLFAKAIDTSVFHVFLTPGDARSRGLAVVARDVRGFVVHELGGGSGTYDFDYRVVARRRGLAPEHRLAKIKRPRPAATLPRELLSAPPAPDGRQLRQRLGRRLFKAG